MEGYEKVAVIDNQFEAQLLAAILVERDIPHIIKSYYDVAYDGIFQMQKGWGAVFAPAPYSEEIGEILAGLRTPAE
jgi:hypothetical protein